MAPCGVVIRNFRTTTDSSSSPSLNLIGLAIIPTMVSMLTIAISSRYIGPTKTAVLGVFEPLTAILIGTLMFGETLTAKMATGS